MQPISQEELEQQNVVDLPDRDAMQVIAIGSPVNALSIAVALNVFSFGSGAFAGAISNVG